MSDGKTQAKKDFMISNDLKQQMSSGVAVKADSGKVEYHHMPPEALEQVMQVFTFGGKKYSAYNFRNGFNYSRPFNAAMRHLWAWWRGENTDPESNLSHLAHAACCIIMLLDFEKNKSHLDDRYKPVNLVTKSDEITEMLEELNKRHGPK